MSSPSQPPPSSNGSKHLQVAMPSLPRVTEMAQAPVNAQVNNVAVNLPPTPDASLFGQMSDEKFIATIGASLKHQELLLAQQAKRLDLKDDESKRKHQRSMKRLDLRAEEEKGSRNFTYLFGTLACVAIVGVVGFLLYKGEYDAAKTIITLLVGAVFGYLGGRIQSRGKSLKKADEND